MIHRPKDTFQAQTPGWERHRLTKSQISRFKSPDVKKLTAIEVPTMRAIFYPATKKSLKRKIAQLKLAGIDYIIKKD
jgi:hypothetical protein